MTVQIERVYFLASFSRYYQSILINSKSKSKDVRLWIEELLKYEGETELLQKFRNWDAPKFPLSGYRLIEMKVPSKYHYVIRLVHKLSGFFLNIQPEDACRWLWAISENFGLTRILL